MTSPEDLPGRFRLRDAAISWREVDGEVIALDVESGEYLSLNGSGRILWMALVEPVSIEELGKLLTEQFGVSADIASADASAFVSDLVERSLLDEVA
ncbi:MAG TPA: PqqD family protein [Acidimicrobiales bacterium]